MLEIEMEVKKGILYVYLKGELNKNNIKKMNDEVIKLMKDIELNNLVFNFYYLKEIDLKGIKSIITSYNYIKRKKGYFLIEKANDKIQKTKLKKYMGDDKCLA